MADFKLVEIPARMRDLPKDRRGYPIPVNVLIDKNGKPHFTINDDEKRQLHLQKKQCPICGSALLRGRWTVGGPASAFMDEGAYIDPPMHYECYRYAMQVCPYLALPSFTKRIDAGTVKREDVEDHRIFIDNTVLAHRPPLFVAVMHLGEDYQTDIFGNIHHFKPKRPYRNIEYWQNGNELSAKEGRALADAYVSEKRQSMLDEVKSSKGPSIINLPSKSKTSDLSSS
jgi:hypothetical protein